MVALLLALLAAPETVETEHYRLVSEGPRAEAEEFGRVLEAAYAKFAVHFRAKPKLGRGEKLGVRFFELRAAWEADVKATGFAAPAASGGYYCPADRIMRFYRQPTRLTTRSLLLHEATHQFHYLACTGNRAPGVYWYQEGVAECLGWNHWDGRELVLGVVPLVSLENYPAQALAELRGGIDIESIVEGRAEGSRPVAWAIYRHLSTGNAGKPLKGFERIAGKLDGGAMPSSLFWKSFGQPEAYRRSLVAWLEKEQQPFVPVFVEWEPLGPARIRGFASVFTACRLEAKATRFEATIETPKEGGWRAGGLLSYAGPDDYVSFLVHAGGLRVSRRRAGGWETIEDGAAPTPSEDGNYRFVVSTGEAGVRLVFEGGGAYGPWRLSPPTFGLAVDSSDVVFGNLGWK